MNLALFDVDGTLIHYDAVYTTHTIGLLDRLFGIRIEAIPWGEFEHVTDTFVISELFRRHLRRDPAPEELRRYRRAYAGELEALRASRPESFREIAGARAALDALDAREDWAVALATGGSRDAALTKLRSAGFRVDHLPGGFAEDGISRQDIVRAAIAGARQHHGVTAFRRVVSVGDALWDLTTARELGLEFVAILSGNNRLELERAGATRFHETYAGAFHREFGPHPTVASGAAAGAPFTPP